MAKVWLNRTVLKALTGVGVVVGGSVLGLKLVRGNVEDSGLGAKKPATTSQLVPTVNASWTTNYTPSVKWDHDWDKRSPESFVKPKSKNINTDENNNDFDNNNNNLPKPKASRHLILIRHGQYYEDADTDEKRILTPLGRDQAAYTGARLKELGYPYTVLTHSTMSRATETAEIILKHLNEATNLKVKSCDFLREGAPIPPEPPIGNWRPLRKFYEDGPRIEAAFRRYFYRASVSQLEDSYEILVCHANVIRYFVCRALQVPPEAWLRFSLHHGSITWITIRPSGRVSIVALGDCGYMPSKKISLR